MSAVLRPGVVWRRGPSVKWRKIAELVREFGVRYVSAVRISCAAVRAVDRMGRLFIEPEMRALRGDPRFLALRKRFGLP